ncbi:MAG: 30S ribosomal protein S16 [Deltaproteobacteria bacterium]|jgi:small subunit ribosomal protein S16|nr:30S ribosomal protein S16 [Deltaproteobacteria bacterium]
MVKIRMKRGGAKKRPHYRVIAIDHREKRDGRALEYLGTYDPISEPPEIKLDAEKIQAWVDKGAQLAPSVKALLKRARKLGQDTPPAPVEAAGAAEGTA